MGANPKSRNLETLIFKKKFLLAALGVSGVQRNLGSPARSQKGEEPGDRGGGGEASGAEGGGVFCEGRRCGVRGGGRVVCMHCACARRIRDVGHVLCVSSAWGKVSVCVCDYCN